MLTDVACNKVEFVLRLDQHFAGLAQQVQVACAVEAVLAYGVLLVQLKGQSIHVGMRRHTLVKCCIKDCDLQPTQFVEGEQAFIHRAAMHERAWSTWPFRCS